MDLNYSILSQILIEFISYSILSQILSVFISYSILSQVFQGEQSYIVVFAATAPALGFTTYFVQLQPSKATAQVSAEYANAPFQLENNYLRVSFDTFGNIVSVYNKENGKTVPLSQQYYYYRSNPGDSISSQASGAYIFRPLVNTAYFYNTTSPQVSIINGSVVSEVRRYFQPDLSQVVRLYADQAYIEIEDIVGPIDVSDKIGKEVITRYTTNFNSENIWFSDSNGIELIQRKTNYRPSWNFTVTEPIAGNYVPVNAITALRDRAQGVQLTVVVDRSRSSASLTNGQLETMIHRRCLVDDGRGVGEPLNETTIMASKEWLVISNTSSAASIYRPLAKRVYHPFVLAFGPNTPAKTWTSQYLTDYAPLGITLPPNVQLLNFVPLAAGQYILRLHHIYQVGEDAVLSQPVTVDIANLLKGYILASVEETQLTAVAPVKRLDAINLHAPITAAPIYLDPAEIRTFLVTFKRAAADVGSSPSRAQPVVHIA